MKHYIILCITALCLQTSAGAQQISETSANQKQEAPEFEAQKLKSAVLLKYGGFAVACIGGAVVSIPLAAVGGFFGLVGSIAQDVHTVKLANSYAYVATNESGGAAEFWESHNGPSGLKLSKVKLGSAGKYQASKKESYPFVVIEIKEATSDDKIIRIEYTDDSGEKEQKLMKASNSKLSFTNY